MDCFGDFWGDLLVHIFGFLLGRFFGHVLVNFFWFKKMVHLLADMFGYVFCGFVCVIEF